MKKYIRLILLAIFLAGCGELRVAPVAEYRSDAGCPARVEALRQSPDASASLPERYKVLTVIDVHYHGNALLLPRGWDQYHIERTVLFERISEPAAQTSDVLSWLAYRLHPDRIYPNFAGIPVYETRGVMITRANLEQGYLGIGEIVGASSNSPVTSKLAWKANQPDDGELPKIYDLAASYQVPVLLHIDPPNGYPVQMLEQAMRTHSQTVFIFAHANAYNSPGNIERLLSQYPNLYIDFFAGFTAYNSDSSNSLSDFAALIEKYPERFLVSTDGGYDIGYEKAALAIYELLDLLKARTACRVAYQNYEQIIEAQLPTATQVTHIQDLSKLLGKSGAPKLNKRGANELIFELEHEMAKRTGAGLLTSLAGALWIAKRRKNMQGQSQGQAGQKDLLTKILAVSGTVLVWVPLLAPVGLSMVTLVARGVFRFDFLMPGELFPVVFAGGGLLVWAALRARSQRKLILWSFGSAVGALVFSQVLAVLTGLASGDNQSEVVFGIVIVIFVGYILAAIVTGVGGILLLRNLFKST